MNSQQSVTRRDALKTLSASAALLGLGKLSGAARAADNSAPAASANPMPAGANQGFVLPKLGYAYDALEPHFDARTMEIHHSKHHQAYITNAVKALADYPQLQNKSPDELIKDVNALPEAVRTGLRNNVGGHVNHAFFWRVIGPTGGGGPSGELAQAISRTFGSFDQFKTQFADAAMKRFGSGWAWLTAQDGKLAIVSTANQDSPLSEGARPLLGLDVWEHAYYLKYQNRRADYVTAFWQVVNWSQVAANYGAGGKAP